MKELRLQLLVHLHGAYPSIWTPKGTFASAETHTYLSSTAMHYLVVPL